MEGGNINPKPLLYIERLAVGYEGHVLLENLNLELKAGELVCFMGPNGIGKSTLIKTIIGLHKPLAGEIHFSEQGPRERAASVVLTDRIQHPQLTVYELISMGRYPYLDWRMKMGPDDVAKINESITHVRIPHLRDEKISELSDGQMQMVMIARALTQDTRVLLLDEPTAHLDLNNRVEIMNLLKRLSRETHRAILMTTHELDLALQTADEVWIAGPDRSIKTGIPEDLVLDGSFDNVFQFKGYDLKTGKVAHDQFRGKQVCMKGEGYALLWTRNALERTGYSIAEDGAVTVEILTAEKQIKWKLGSMEFYKLSLLIDHLAGLP